MIVASITILIVVVVGVVSAMWYRQKTPDTDLSACSTEDHNKITKKKVDHNNANKKSQPKMASQSIAKIKIVGTSKKDHPLYVKEIGGHSTSIIHLAMNLGDTLLATCSTDGMIKCLPVCDIGASMTHDVHAVAESPPTALAVSQNGKRIVAAINGNIRFYSVNLHTKKMEVVKEFVTGWSSIHALQLMDVEQWMVIVAAGITKDNKTIVRAYNQKENVLNTFAQHAVARDKHNKIKHVDREVHVVTSPDDRLIAITGVDENNSLKEDEVGIYEIKRRTDGSAIGLQQVMALAGHVSPVIAVAWNSAGKRLVTVCADGTWRFWDVSIRYDDKPRLFSGDLKLENGRIPSRVAIVQGDIVVFCCDRDLYFCNSGDGSVIECIKDALGNCVRIMRAFEGGMLFATVVDGAKRIPVWKALL